MTDVHCLSSGGGINEKPNETKTYNRRNKKPSFSSKIFNIFGC